MCQTYHSADVPSSVAMKRCDYLRFILARLQFPHCESVTGVPCMHAPLWRFRFYGVKGCGAVRPSGVVSLCLPVGKAPLCPGTAGSAVTSPVAAPLRRVSQRASGDLFSHHEQPFGFDRSTGFGHFSGFGKSFIFGCPPPPLRSTPSHMPLVEGHNRHSDP